MTLPGVARKTANIVLSAGYGKAEGIAVDTHAGRLSRRLGLSRQDDPVKVERDLMAARAQGRLDRFQLPPRGARPGRSARPASPSARAASCGGCARPRQSSIPSSRGHDPRGHALGPRRRRRRRLPPLRPPLRHQAGESRRLRRPREPGRAARDPRLRRGRRGPRRPHRKEAPLSFLSRIEGHVHRHAGLQLPLRLLPELADLPGARGGRPAAWPASRSRPRPSSARPSAEGCRSISYTYTEPTIFFEYAYDTARLAREAGLANNFVTNGYMTAEALDDDPAGPRRRQRRPQGLPRRDL